jgi:hypothetical protein
MFKKCVAHGSGLFIVTAFLVLLTFTVRAEAEVADSAELGFEIIKTHVGDVLSILAADIDHDGNTDIVYSGILQDLYFSYGRPDGTFEMPVWTLPTYQAILVSGFVNGDTLVDLIIGHDDTVYVMINQGNRNFKQVKIPKNSPCNMGGIATGFFNSDPYLDMVVGPGIIFFGDGQGNFPARKSFVSFVQTAYVSDFNNDGIDDIVVLNTDQGAIYLNDGSANFTKSSSFVTGNLALALSSNESIADFNHDGNADIAFVYPAWSHYSASLIKVGYGDGHGGILSLTTLPIRGTSYSLAVADVNRDNNLDLIASDATYRLLTVFVGDGGGQFHDSLYVSYNTDSIMHAMATADVDRDGNPDFVAGAFWGDSVVIAINTLPDEPILAKDMVTTGYSNVNLEIRNPKGSRISRNYRSVAGCEYRRLDVNGDYSVDEQTVDHNLQYGEYTIIIKRKLNVPDRATFSATVRIGADERTFFKNYQVPGLVSCSGGYESDSIVFRFVVEPISSIQPPSGAVAESDQPLFDWSGFVGGPPLDAEYNFQLDRYVDFRSPLYDEYNLDTPTFNTPSPLGADSVYYWRFRTFDGLAWSEFSPAYAVCTPPKPLDAGPDYAAVVPEDFSLSPNFPNPFNSSTIIEYEIPYRSYVELLVYNLLGQKIRTLVEETEGAGVHHASWDGCDASGRPVAAGIYFYSLKSGDFAATSKMILLK